MTRCPEHPHRVAVTQRQGEPPLCAPCSLRAGRHHPPHPNGRTQMKIQNIAHAVLHEMLSATLVRQIDTALEEGRAHWRRDPVNRTVYALFIGDVTGVIVYTAVNDFEIADDIHDLLETAQ